MNYHDTYKYVIHSDRKSYGALPNFVDVASNVRQGFISLYQVDSNTAEAVQQTGTTKGFKGVVWSDWLWIDTDSYEAADTTERRLKELELSYVAYDSGGRGAHFGIMRHNTPSHLLPAMDKAWVASTFAPRTVDTSIYTHLHLFRLPGTIHESTGRRKTLVSEHHANILTVPALKEEHVYIPSSNGNMVSVFDCFRVMANSKPTARGERHSQLVTLTYALKDDARTSREAALFWVFEVNKLFSEPKAQEEIEKIVNSIYG